MSLDNLKDPKTTIPALAGGIAQIVGVFFPEWVPICNKVFEFALVFIGLVISSKK